MQYYFPAGLKPTPVRKRERFYREEFPQEHVSRRIGRWYRFIPLMDIGSETTLYKPQHKELKGKLVGVKTYKDVEHLSEKIASYAPEDIYYRRTIEKDGEVEVNPQQELVFRIEPLRLDCKQCRWRREEMEPKWRRYVFCYNCFEEAAEETQGLYSFLGRHFDDVDIVYSGLGFNLHVNDEAGFRMKMDDRTELARKVATEFPIEEDVTAGEHDLVRLPGSLNGLVSRKATVLAPGDLNDPEYVLETKTVPVSLQQT